ncbi:substrate-binding domain-containing protein [Terrarubrum flagellatum]|uniref:substrate-binding domain-containing protein n=1 Tax=Terrirubrum flagellatum TaxID=2895980 RepID=UPI003144EFEA
MEQKGIGIRELARRLNISIGTVSRALNGREDVSPVTRSRVLEAASRFGYAPNQSGRALRQGVTRAVALMMRTNVDIATFGETFFLNLSEGLQGVLAQAGLDLIVLPCGSGFDQDQYLRRAVERGLADGFIVSDTQRIDARIDYLLARGIPFVALGRSLSGGDHPWIDLDFEGVAEQAVDRLARSGHRRIALGLTTREANSRVVFADAFEAALRRRGIEPDPALVVRAPETVDGGYELGQALLSIETPPTAIVLGQSTHAIGLYRYLRDRNLEPGRDIAIIGFRDNPACQFLTPALTCFRVSLRELGACLGETLLSAMQPSDGEVESGERLRLWPLSLVQGESDARFHRDAKG